MNAVLRSFQAAAALALAAAGNTCAAAPLADAHMAGHWTGTAQIVVNWTTQRQLAVDLTIAPDGTVTGRIGDATLAGAALRSNRGWLGRTLHLATDWIIIGDLAGDLIKAESIHRSGVKLPLNWNGRQFKGGVNSSGSKFGGKESMVLAATGLILRRQD